MNLKAVPGVALVTLAAVSSGAAPPPTIVFPLPAKLAPFVLPSPPLTKIFPPGTLQLATPAKLGPQLIPTQITGHAELIPTNWPDMKILLLNR